MKNKTEEDYYRNQRKKYFFVKTKRKFCKEWDSEKDVFFVFPSTLRWFQYIFYSVCVNFYMSLIFKILPPPHLFWIVFVAFRIITIVFIEYSDSIVKHHYYVFGLYQWKHYMMNLNFRTINHWHITWYDEFCYDCGFTSAFMCV